MKRLPPLEFVLSLIAGLLATSVAGIFVRPRSSARPLVYGGTGVLCLVLALWAFLQLAFGGGGGRLVLPVGLPWLSAHFRVDALSALFLMVVNAGGATASLFGYGYEEAHDGAHGHDAHGSGPVLPLFPLFLAGMNLVVMADDAFVFLVSWEFMSMASWLLVLSTHREQGTEKAAQVYLIMAAFGTMCLLLAFGLLAGADGNYSFAAMRTNAPPDWAVALAVMLVLVGAGSKAGLVPLHVWLPLAHPAAPSHVSALMSGVMTKVAIYGMIRVMFDIAGQPAWWWGAVVMAAGAVTTVVGILQALEQSDVKRLLAYSTVENVGIIVVGLGVALVFKVNDSAFIFGLALAASLMHVLNHSLFKSLLFFGAGAVLTATGTRDLGRLGGLARVMPQMSVLVLIGCTAISALPPLNGFVGEWMLFQAILNGPILPQWALKVGMAVVAAAVALAAALAAACFVRFYGVAFLGRARSDVAANAVEPGLAMRLGVAIPAVGCVVIGILPVPFIRLIEPIVWLLGGAGPLAHEAGLATFTLTPLAALGNAYNGAAVVLAVLLMAVAMGYGIHRYAMSPIRRAIPWGCGHVEADPAGVSQYTASSTSQPIRRAIGSALFSTREIVDMPEPGDIRPAKFQLKTHDPAWTFIFDPLVRIVDVLARRMNVLQFLSIRRYLTLMFFALLILLVIVAAGQQ